MSHLKKLPPGTVWPHLLEAIERDVVQDIRMYAQGHVKDVMRGGETPELATLLPTFRWQVVDRADDYTVTDGRFAIVVGGVTHETTRTPVVPLTRGRTYVRQVTAHPGCDSVTAPAPPHAEACFAVMGVPTARRPQRLAATSRTLISCAAYTMYERVCGRRRKAN
jgi:hypothetical protein